MKILHLTDLHFNQYVFSWIKEMQRNYDVICLTGDLIDARKNVSAKEQADTILEWLHELDVPVFVCSGNHDVVDGSYNWLRDLPRGGWLNYNDWLNKNWLCP